MILRAKKTAVEMMKTVKSSLPALRRNRRKIFIPLGAL